MVGVIDLGLVGLSVKEVLPAQSLLPLELAIPGRGSLSPASKLCKMSKHHKIQKKNFFNN